MEINSMKTSQATGEIFFTAFKALASRDKQAFLERVLSDQKLREDLIDVALIEKAKKTRGTPVSAREYFARRRKAGN
jgi:hypothetical protein